MSSLSGASKSRSQTPNTHTKPVADIYRQPNISIQKTIAPLLPSASSASTLSLPDILGIPPSTYTARVTGKNLLLDPKPTTGDATPADAGPSKAVSDLVRGKKRHRGHPAELVRARTEAQDGEKRRRVLGVEGLRKVRKRVREGGGVVGRGVMRGIDYESLLPLHHLHLSYITSLLSLPPLPTNIPPASSSATATLPHGLTPDNISSKLLKADLTGAHLAVLSCRNPSIPSLSLASTPTSPQTTHTHDADAEVDVDANPTGLAPLHGLVIEETAHTFRILPSPHPYPFAAAHGSDALVALDPSGAIKSSPASLCATGSTPQPERIRVIPKHGTLFRLSFPAYAPPPIPNPNTNATADPNSPSPLPPPDWASHALASPHIQLDILGSAFAHRSAERAGRKFRPAQGGGGGSGWAGEWVEGEWSDVLRGVEADLGVRAGEGADLGKKGRGEGTKGKGKAGKRKKGKSRRKDPPAWGRLEIP